MSTRGAVAVLSEDGKHWRGVYNHSDSYPTGLGAEVWQELDAYGVQDLSKNLLQYGDWREYKNKGICQYCGKKAGQAHSISGAIYGREKGGVASPGGIMDEEERFKTPADMTAYYQSLPAWKGRDKEITAMVKREFDLRQEISKTGYPDVAGKFHKHGESTADQFTDKTGDPLDIEWVYILDPKTKTVTVMVHYSTGRTTKAKSVSGQEYEHSVYGWRVVDSFAAPSYSVSERNRIRGIVVDYVRAHPDVPKVVLLHDLAGKLTSEELAWALSSLQTPYGRSVLNESYSSPGYSFGDRQGKGTTFSVDPKWDGKYPETQPDWEKVEFAGDVIRKAPANATKINRRVIESLCDGCRDVLGQKREEPTYRQAFEAYRLESQRALLPR